MNEQLRKAIEDATTIYPWPVPMSMGGGDVLDVNSHRASQAKLIKVIERLIEQRDLMAEYAKPHYMVEPLSICFEAELIKILVKSND